MLNFLRNEKEKLACYVSDLRIYSRSPGWKPCSHLLLRSDISCPTRIAYEPQLHLKKVFEFRIDSLRWYFIPSALIQTRYDF